ncbi:glycine-rich domain-containing protein [Novacetimonas hansenii]|uniref:Glycine-rich domain-containing protein n=1 Tax=Novacetimonas hansenii TaxID=436 RepID=A0ABQ0SH21_NOVHA|nr:hypothetical protein [Novacetimonas hansenii]GAN84034.1 tail fiber protein [Novacetimonas hansenii JCM 7643]GBQ55830.1 hypothetical protein AA0243_1022 [Novacetimonas hansenii NRIC 0243]GEC64614.1 hypothetical protein GHA01_24630 [Novacetimonas hansenii]
MQNITFNEPDPSTGKPGTLVPVDWFQNVNDEISNVVTNAGITLDSTNHLQLTTALSTIYAPLLSPAFKGTPTCPTPDTTDDSQKICNTAWVKSYVTAGELGYTPVRQGGVSDQTNDTVYIGNATDGSGLKATVNTTDLGNFAFESWVEGNYLNLAGGNITGSLTLQGTTVATVNTVNAAEADVKNLLSEETERAENVESIISSTYYPISSSTTITVPTGVTRVYLRGIGAGGGAMGCAAVNTTQTYSGSGGGSGGIMEGVYSVTGGDTLKFTIGSGGAGNIGPGSGYYGGVTSCVNGAGQRLQSLPSGSPGVKSTTTNTAGGAGAGMGTSDVSGTFRNDPGNDGQDGQAGTAQLSGAGGPGPGGVGGARSGLQGGQNGTAYGAGGGGAYDTGFTGNNYAGGSGASGFFLYKWLP